jgi:hypothetical protein
MLVKKQNGGFYGLTEADQEQINNLPNTNPVRVEIKAKSPRNVEHHQKYWAGLLALAFDYWEPTRTMITYEEKLQYSGYLKFLRSQGIDTTAIQESIKQYLSVVDKNRKHKHKVAPKTLEQLHEWVKLQAGYYHVYSTPAGIRRMPMSISFASMRQEEFNAYYKAAFNVIWEFVLQQYFPDEQAAKNAISQLLSLT